LLRSDDDELIEAVHEGELRLTVADKLLSEAAARKAVLGEG